MTLYPQHHTLSPSLVIDLVFLLLPASRRITRPIHRPLHMARDPVLARVELASNHPIFAQRAANLLADLADGAVGIELLADGAGGGDDGGVLGGIRT